MKRIAWPRCCKRDGERYRCKRCRPIILAWQKSYRQRPRVKRRERLRQQRRTADPAYTLYQRERGRRRMRESKEFHDSKKMWARNKAISSLPTKIKREMKRILFEFKYAVRNKKTNKFSLRRGAWKKGVIG